MAKRLAWVFSFLALFTSVSGQTLIITQSTNDPAITYSGSPFLVTLQYTVSSTTLTANNSSIRVNLPSSMQYLEAFGNNQVTNISLDAGTNDVIFQMINPLPAGSTGELSFRVQFPNFTTPNNTVGSIVTSFVTSNLGTINSNVLNFQATATPDITAYVVGHWSMVMGEMTGHHIGIYYPWAGNLGSLNQTNCVAEYVLPQGVTFVSATGNYVWDAFSRTVRWNLPNLDSNTWGTGYQYMVYFIVEDWYYNVGDMVPFELNIHSNPLGEGPYTKSIDFNAWVNNGYCGLTTYMPNQRTDEFQYLFPGSLNPVPVALSNYGNTPLLNLDYVMNIPPQLKFDYLNFYGFHAQMYTGTINFMYKTNYNSTWMHLTGSPYAYPAGSISLWPAALAVGEYVTAIKVNFPNSFVPNSECYLGFMSYLLNQDRNGNPVNANTQIPFSYYINANCGSQYGTYSQGSSSNPVTGHWVVAPASLRGYTGLYVQDHNGANKTIFQKEDGIRFSGYMSFEGASISNPVFKQIIPKGVIIESTEPVATSIVPNFNGNGETLITWDYNGSTFNPAISQGWLQAVVYGRIAEHAIAGEYESFIYLVDGDGIDVYRFNRLTRDGVSYNGQLKYLDVYDLNNNGLATDTIYCTGSRFYNVLAQPSMKSTMWVNGSLDADWSKFPNVGSSVAGGLADYKLVIENDGTVPLGEVKVIDVLPFVGDVGVIDPSARASQWRPNLAGEVIAPPGVTVMYSTQTNPCRTDLGISGPAGCQTPVWSSTLPTDITDVQSLKFDFGTQLLMPGDSLVMTWPMRIPNGTGTGLIAWNSFGYRARRDDNDNYLLAAEPNKVGIEVEAPQPPIYGDYVWFDTNGNGLQDEPASQGANGIEVELYHVGPDNTPGTSDDYIASDQNGNTMTTITGNDASGNPGYFSFGNLMPHNAYIRFVIPTGFVASAKNGSGANASNDSDVNPTTARTDVFAITIGTINNSFDLGISAFGVIGNFVWRDTNNNGVFDEPVAAGMNNVPVELWNASTNTFIASVMTTNNSSGNPGYYEFRVINSGTYKIKFPSNYLGLSLTTANTSSGIDNNSNANTTTGFTGDFDIDVTSAGLLRTNNTIDAGYVCATLNPQINEVRCNNNGTTTNGGDDFVTALLTPSPNGLHYGTTYSLTATQGGSPVAVTLSDGTPASGLSFGYPSPIRFANGSSNGAPIVLTLNASTGCSTAITITSPASCSNLAACTTGSYTHVYRSPMKTTGGEVPVVIPKFDNANGNRTLTSVNVNTQVSVVMNLLIENGTVATTTENTTEFEFSESGQFSFDLNGNPALIGSTTIASGNPTVSTAVIVPPTNAWPGDTFDQTVFWGAPTMTNFGLHMLQDDMTIPLNTSPFWISNLTGNASSDDDFYNLLSTVAVDENYVFSNAADLSHFLGSGMAPLQVSEEISYSTSGSGVTSMALRTKMYTITTVTYNYECARGAVGDFVWHDLNTNGVQDDGPTGIGGVSVALHNCNGTVVSTTTTDPSGYYFFNDVPSNQEYYLQVANLPNGYAVSAIDLGGDNNSDSDFDPITYRTNCFIVTPASSISNMDAGLAFCSTPILVSPQPGDAQIVCGAALPAIPNLTFTDPIYGNLNAIYTQEFLSDACGGYYLRTWTVSNPCGNRIVVDQNIDVIDTTAPTLFGVPADATMECGVVVPNAVVAATDNCDTNPTVSLNAVTVPLACGYQLVRTWTATDACGNVATQTQVTTFEDTTNPVLANLPNNSTVSCAAVPVAGDFAVTASDVCDNNVTITTTTVDVGSGCNIVRTITWRATDDCGNSVGASRTFTTEDTSAPVLAGLPANGTVDCGAMPTGASFGVVANDNCDTNVNLTSTFADVQNGCNIARTITWTAIDDCGNTSTASRTFTSSDTVDPELFGVPADATMECGVVVPNAVVAATDNCDTNPTVSLNAVTVPLACGYQLVRTWTATDACGNTVSQTQTTTFEDTTDPVLAGLPANSTVSCAAVPAAGDFAVTASDACDNDVTITTSTTDVGSGCNIIRTITWTATDDCGHSVSASRVFTTEDTTAPVFAGLPSNGTVDCGAMPTGASYGVVANDNCDTNVNLTSTFADVQNGCNIARTITWTATDDCGNTSTASRTFTSSDTVAPELFGVPADATMECGVVVPNAVVAATDNCDTNPTVSLNAVTVPLACGYQLVRTWTAVDACGNTVSQTQTTTFDDTTDPVLAGLPANSTVSCAAVPVAGDFAVTASDVCDNNVTITTTTVDVGSGCNIERTITWTATDDCGNTVSASRIFTTEDTTAPVMAGLPVSAVVDCGAMPTGASFGVVANDNCDTSVTLTSSHTDAQVGAGTVRTITWVATDDCGNSVSASRQFTSDDATDPELFGVPADATMECGVVVPDAVVAATDNCDQNPVVSLNAVTVPLACGYQLVRTWTATDASGNSVSQTQITTFEDTTDPVLAGLPANSTVSCAAVPAAGDFAVTASDACDNDVTITTSTTDVGSGCNIIRTITWTATDDCGHSVSASRVFTTEDTTAPVFAGLPSNGTVDCGAMPTGASYGVVANDNCDTNVNLTSTFADVQNGCNIARTITWTATDDCGNTSTASRTFTSSDTVAPELFGVPADATMECGVVVPIAVVAATDNCDTNPTVSLNAVTVPLACGYQLVRTWTAVDACGNTVSQTQTTTFEDTTDPVLAGLPASSTVSCAAVPVAGDFAVTASDVCDNNVTITTTTVDVGSGCNIERTITWMATDDCGNTVSASRVFTTEDTTAPIMAGLPISAVVDCGAMPTGSSFGVVANDNCDTSVTLTSSHTDAQVGAGTVRTITWVATDDCGNSVSASRQFTSDDSTAPELFGVPADATMECGVVVPDAVVSATDNCDQNPVVSLNAVTVPLACGYQLVRTWTATDASGNSVSQTQITTFEDTTDPVLSNLPANSTVSCAAVPDASDFAVTASDACDNDVTITTTTTDVGSGCNIIRTITWTATDDCGHQVTASRVFTTEDTTAPVFAGLPADGTVDCGAMPTGASYGVVANDNCDTNVNLTSTFADVQNGCNIARTITWTSTDDCGNTSTASRTFTSSDTVAPELFGVPADATMECGVVVPNAVVAANDNCDTNPTVSLNAVTVPLACGYQLVRTWTATDACGNTVSQTQTTTFEDTTDPVLAGLPANSTVSCAAVPEAGDFAVTASDACDNDVTITTTTVDVGSGCNIERTITWTATDDCGNTVSASRVFTTEDTTAPVMAGLPVSAVVDCGAMPTGSSFGVVANDNCDTSVTLTSSHTDAQVGAGTVRTITWVATDDCGNSVSASRQFTSDDSTAPELFGVPADATMECGVVVPDAVVAATDNCDQNLVVSLNAVTVPLACGYQLVRTWTATDASGNSVSQTQITTFEDTTDPVLSNLPANSTVSCAAVPDASDFAVTASDACDNDVTITTSTTDVGSGCNIIRTITWTATDDCGHQVTASRVFTTEDTTAPVFAGLPADGTVDCGAMPTGASYGVVANDNCDTNVNLTSTFADVQNGCNISRTITWTATDDCGNTSSASRTFTSSDTVAPELFGVPADATMECGVVVPIAVVAATDNCDTNPTVSLNAVTVPLACGYQLVRTWTATDACGNTVSQTQVTTFEDNINPELFDIPASSVVDCGVIPEPIDFIVTATDACDAGVVITTASVDSGVGCNRIRTITWTATDDCGHQTSASVVFEVTDTTLPELSGLPDDATVDCGSLPTGTEFPVTAADNCIADLTVTATYSDELINCQIVRTITWVATDDCGNSTEASRVFTTNDQIAPEMYGVPSDMVLNCGDAVPDAVVVAIDNCDQMPIVSLSAETQLLSCGYQLLRTWTATDACGNVTEATQITTFQDIVAPTFIGIPENTAVPCGQLPFEDSFLVSATDICDNDVTITSSVSDAVDGCHIVRTITWTATDNCGNTTEASTIFTSEDTSAPTLVGIPESATVDCGSLPTGESFGVTATDNCAAEIAIASNFTDTNNGCVITRTIVWTATDACGNQTTAEAVFTTSDTEAPILVGVPQDVTLECGMAVPNAVVEVLDNCDAGVVVNLNAQTVQLSCGYQIVRTWTATDACGNTTSGVQTTTFVDSQQPVLAGLPANATVVCGMLPEANEFDVTASDVCDSDVTITTSVTDTAAGCNVVRTITWTATDDCGNTTEASVEFTSEDSSSPVLVNVPESATVDCGSLPTGDSFGVTATDNCAAEITIASNFTDTNEGCVITRTIVWTATDACGNQTTAEAVFTTNDTEAPILVGVPQDVTLECGMAVPEAVVEGIDNCDMNVVVSLSAETVSLSCGYQIVRTWTATDACGNSTTGVQTTTFEDTQDPILSNIPSDATVTCGMLPAASDFDVTASDICDNNVNMTSSITDEAIGCNVVRTITWIATDDCGNTTEASAVFTSEDTSSPVLVNVPESATVDCGSIPTGDSFGVTATDNCSAEITIASNFTDTNDGCVITRTIVWTATDACGNQTTAEAVFTTSDTETPILVGVPQDVTLECGMAVPEAVVEIIDNCDMNVVVSLSAETISLSCGYQIVRTWTATDACGNSTTGVQTATFEDTQDPSLSNIPSAATVTCGMLPAASDFDVIASDICDNNVTITSSITDEAIGCNVVRTITWIATDDCGNTTEVSAVFTSEDTSAPVLVNVPESATVDCGSLPTGESFGVTATDNCAAEITIASNFTDTNDGCVITRNIVWTATDACGNQTSAQAVFTSSDTEAPILFGVPQDVTLECGMAVPNAIVEVVDNCDAGVVVGLSAETIALACGYQIVRTWTSTDACGNTSIGVQTTTFVDTQVPTLSGVPINTTVTCGMLPAPSDFVVLASDICDSDVTITSSFEDVAGGCNMVRTITWTATDDCGNTTEASAVFTSEDTSSPVLVNVPESATVDCGSLPIGDSFGVTATDNCASEITIASNFTDTNDGCVITRTIVWTATDACGNQTTAEAVFTTSDTDAPNLFGVPQDVTLECGMAVPNAIVEVVDNCDAGAVVGLSAETIALACGYQIVRTWTSTDACGNTSIGVQTTTFVDTQVPTLSGVPINATVTCGMLPAPSDFVVLASDICDSDVTITSSFEDVAEGCNMVRTITWTATDDCGNTTEASAVFTSEDTSSPVLVNAPESATVDCGSLPTGDSFGVTATDNCASEIAIASNFTDTNDGCVITRTIVWTATDACGNQTTAEAVFTTSDTEAPVLVGVPQDVTLECGMAVPNAEVEVVDNCDAGVVVDLSAETIAMACGYQIVRTWRSTDACGNTAAGVQVITFEDTQAPVLVDLPADSYIEVPCGVFPEPTSFGVSAQDNCTALVTVLFNVDTIGEGCMESRVYTWTAEDDCGHLATASVTYQSVDAESPVFSNVPTSLAVGCQAIPVLVEPTVTDNCDMNLELVFVQDTIMTCPITIVRTWTAQDDCGNSSTVSQEIELIDTEGPIFTTELADVMLSCEASIETPVVEAIDGCFGWAEVSMTESIVPASCGYSLIRTFTAHDACNNETTMDQVVTVLDEVSPVFNVQPNDTLVTCGLVPVPLELTAVDNCDNNVEISFSEIEISGECPIIIKRVWTATDDCGNTAVVAQVVSVIDDEAPVFVNAEDSVVVECGLREDGQFEVMDNCAGAIDYEKLEEIFVEDDCAGAWIVTYEAVDPCGNSTLFTQYVDMIDTMEPILANVPQDVIVNCNQAIPAVPTDVFAVDVCSGNMELEFHEEVIPGSPCEYAIVRTWMAKDHCGNRVQQSQNIRIVSPETTEVFFDVYPNPSSSSQIQIAFSIPENAIVEGHIYDAAGKLVNVLFEGKLEANSMMKWSGLTRHVDPGLYWIAFIVNDKVYRKPIVIIK